MQDHATTTLLNSSASRLAITLIQALRRRLQNPGFLDRHRRHPKAFTRNRVLTFSVVALFILQKSVKSLQLHLHEFLDQCNAATPAHTVGPGAFTRARAKLSHGAYIELNEEVLLPMVYRPGPDSKISRWRGHRVLSIDSSLIRLPMTAKLATGFGLVECSNQNGKGSVKYPQARISLLYDVLNGLGWDARLEPYAVSEIEVASHHLACAAKTDLILCDRGYAGLFWFILMHSRGIEFVVRCGKGSFGSVQELFRRNEEGLSLEVVLKAHSEAKKQLLQAGLATELRVRLVTVRLSTGELELLATNLLDTRKYPTEEFAQVYHWRWGLETYYGCLKGRLELENWSGKTEEAIRQDFQAAVFLCNLESVVCRCAQHQLAQETAQRDHPARLNRSVCLHTIKSRILELLAGQEPARKVLARLLPLFQANPLSVRKPRIARRQKIPMARSLHYQRNVRKTIF